MVNKPPPRLRLRVTATAETIVRSRHPWLFADSIREQNREGEVGELAVIYDRQDKFLAVGLYDPESPIRVRVLHVGKPQTLDAAWWRERFKGAIARRDGLLDDRNNACRLIHGESDGWPGLVLDRYDATLVLKLYSAAWLPRLDDIVSLLAKELNAAHLVLRLSRNIQDVARGRFGREEGRLDLVVTGDSFSASSPRPSPPLRGREGEDTAPFVNPVVFLETGLRFEADVIKGQKTGFFLDQRDNRRRVETLAAGRAVLNAFSFSGGFSLYAARGGAMSVTDLDISAHALENARRNFALNQASASIGQCRHETVQADAFAWLEKNRDRQFDLIVLDPPSLAKRETERAGAIQAYGKLAASGLRALRPGGIFVAASCSAHVSAKEFFEAVRGAARASRREFEELDTTGHPPDHPANFSEGQYLKCIYLRFR